MKRETLKRMIDSVLIKQLNLDSLYFADQIDEGENMIMEDLYVSDPLIAYKILSEIEYKCGILIDDSKIQKDMTYGEFIDLFYEELQKEKSGFY